MIHVLNLLIALICALFPFLPHWIILTAFLTVMSTFALLLYKKIINPEEYPFLPSILLRLFLFISFFLIPYHIALLNTLIVFSLIYLPYLEKYGGALSLIRGISIPYKILIMAGIIFLTSLGVLFLAFPSAYLFKKVVFSLCTSIVYTFLLSLNLKHMKENIPWILLSAGQMFLLYLYGLLDFRIHLFNVNLVSIVTYAIIVTVITFLTYLLDMLRKKDFLSLVLIQYAVYLLMGKTVFSLFILFFFFHHIIRRGEVELLNLRKTNYLNVMDYKKNLYIYFLPVLISLLFLFVPARRWDWYYTALLGCFSGGLTFIGWKTLSSQAFLQHFDRPVYRDIIIPYVGPLVLVILYSATLLLFTRLHFKTLVLNLGAVILSTGLLILLTGRERDWLDQNMDLLASGFINMTVFLVLRALFLPV